jgi:hypothetical protein
MHYTLLSPQIVAVVYSTATALSPAAVNELRETGTINPQLPDL